MIIYSHKLQCKLLAYLPRRAYLLSWDFCCSFNMISLKRSTVYHMSLCLLTLRSRQVAPLIETQFDAMRGQRRGFNHCINKKSSWERCYYVRAEQTDLFFIFSLLFQGLDSKLRFAFTVAFHSKIATPLVSV